MAIDVAKLEEKIDRSIATSTDIDMSLGGIQFKSMVELMEFSKMMAVSDCAIPPHLRGNPGACLAICTKALRFGFDPFALAEHSFAMDKEVDVTVEQPGGGRSVQKKKVQIIAYDSFVIAAIINAHAPIIGRMKIEYEGEGQDRRCIVSAIVPGEKEPLVHRSPTLGERLKAIGTTDKGYIKGSPLWGNKPDQQLAYDTRRDFCRKYFPEILLGWYDRDEFDENERAVTATDVTPANQNTGLASRIKKKGTKGFHPDNMKAIDHKPGETLPETAAKPEPVPVERSEIDTEIEQKRAALAQCTDADEVQVITEGVTDLLREKNREDLLPGFLETVSKEANRIASQPAGGG